MAQMPMILKGIMTVRGAEKAVEAGAAAIVVSNHGRARAARQRRDGGCPA